MMISIAKHCPSVFIPTFCDDSKKNITRGNWLARRATPEYFDKGVGATHDHITRVQLAFNLERDVGVAISTESRATHRHYDDCSLLFIIITSIVFVRIP